MNMSEQAELWKKELHTHLTEELLPFWLKRCRDDVHGGFITHFDEHGDDTGEDEKSLIAQARTVYTMSSLHRNGYGGGRCGEFASHGVDYLLETMRDRDHEGFFWLTDRRGTITDDSKIVYGLSFAVYALSEYTLATQDDRGREYAERTFDLLQKYAVDTMYGGYFEMFHRDWTLRGPGSAGGDRKTLDAHMHLMEAFTTLYECTGKDVHRRKLLQQIDIVTKRMLHKKFSTGIPQFFADWNVAPQIKFDTVWGWDRFGDEGTKAQAEDNTSYGHNVEFAWLLLHALDVLHAGTEEHAPVIQAAVNHAVQHGIDREYGGVYVEGSHNGEVYDREKEFWQQAELMIGMLAVYLKFGEADYLTAYEHVHRFVMDRMINHPVGEWWPLMTREGTPIWKHMSHSWKVNYHTLRCCVECIKRLDQI